MNETQESEFFEVPLPVAERLAINACRDVQASAALCTSVGRAQAAVSLAERLPEASVCCHFLDLFQADESRELSQGLENLSIVCTPDPPGGEVDLFVLPLARGRESELARDLLQQGYKRLKTAGQLVATIDNPKDTWLHHEIEKLGKNISRTPKRQGVTYRLKKQKPLKKLKDFSCQFAFRDGERLIQVTTRPGVFSHRRLDVGSRALMEAMQIADGNRVLDVGCGSGAVGFAAALRGADVRVHGLDSNARAIESTERGAELNGIAERVTTQLTASGELGDDPRLREAGLGEGEFDVVVGNPPYYSHYAITEIFLQSALRALRPGGRVWIVSKNEEWLVARMQQLFDEVRPQSARGYVVVEGIQRTRDGDSRRGRPGTGEQGSEEAGEPAAETDQRRPPTDN